MIIKRQKTYSFLSGLFKSNKTKTEQARINEIESRLPKEEYNKLKSLEEELDKIYPGLGDGDEYASYYTLLRKDEITPETKIIPVVESPQGRIDFSYDTEKKTWIDNNRNGKPVSFQQVKQGILKEFKNDEIDWTKNRYWEDDENDKVINYLRNSQKLIQNRL